MARRTPDAFTTSSTVVLPDPEAGDARVGRLEQPVPQRQRIGRGHACMFALPEAPEGAKPANSRLHGVTHDAWVERDAAVVWHGFTQMATYADNHPIIVERAEGHELIDVDGRRYLDAISSLWVTTLGHCVPELDDAIREAARPRRALDDARATGTAPSSSCRKRSPASSRSRTRTSSTPPTARPPSSRR